MWRLLFTMIVVSDTGSVSVTSDHTDWPTQEICQRMAATMYTVPKTSTVNGRRLTAEARAVCVPVGYPEQQYEPPEVYYNPPPPPPPPPFPAFSFGPRGVYIGPPPRRRY